MHWSNDGGNLGAGGYALMTLMMVVFVGLVIAGIMAVIRCTGTRQPPIAQPGHSTPETILADRFARGEIDNDEYRQRMDSLRVNVSP